MDSTTQLIKRIDLYRSLLRHEYISSEKLMRFEVLDNYYASQNKSAGFEKLTCKIEVAEQFSSDLILPLKVRGVFLYEGRPRAKYYTKEEMSKAVDNPLNASFPLMLDHEDNKASMIIGKVNKIEYDPKINGIRWWGHVNSELYARNVLDGVIKEVSATIYSASEYLAPYGLIGKDLTFKELSFVMKGQVNGNYVEVDK